MILTALHGAVLAYLYHNQYNENLALILKSQENMIEFEQARIRTELRDVFQDLLFLEGIVEDNFTDSSVAEVSLHEGSAFYRFLGLLGDLTQRYENIQIVSPDGDELYRKHYDKDGQFQVVPADELRKGIQGYYFQTLKNNAYSLYFSRLKLTEENGVVTKPHTPIIRFGRAITESTGEIIAYLVLDYRGSLILDRLGEYEILPEETFNTYLINNEGYFLSSPDGRPTFAFQFPELKNKTISKELPDLWLQLRMNDSDTYTYKGNLYVHRRIELDRIIPEERGEYLTEKSLNQRSYYLVYETPEPVLKSLSHHTVRSLFIPFLVTQLIILFLSILVTKWTNRLQRYQQKLLHFSSMDEMTGCMNRRTGRKILENYLSLNRRRNSIMTVVYLDLNKLKTVNDELGHREGDHYILTMVDLIKEQLRNTDFFIRMGGDEFLLILPDCSRDQALCIRKRVLVKEYKLNKAEIYPYTLGMSWGILAVAAEQNITVTQILAEADQLMYAEKSNYPQVNDALIKEVEADISSDSEEIN